MDTSTAEFNLSYFVDDVDRTQLETLLLQVKPKEIVLEKGSGGVSDVLKRLVRNSLNDPGINYLVPEKEFWDADRTRIEIKKAGYFQNGGGEGCDDDDVVMQEEDSSSTAASAMPDALKEVYENDVLMTAFGGLVSYLRSVKPPRWIYV